MKISIDTGPLAKAFDLDARYAAIAKAGFTAIDWSLYSVCNLRKPDYKGTCIFEKSLDAVIEHYAEELAIIRKNNLTIAQSHAPFPPYMAGHPEITEYCIDIYKRMIELCDYAGCPILVIHGVDHKFDNTLDTPEDITQLNLHLFESLIPTLKQCNVTVCMENLYVRKYKTSNDDIFIEGPCSDPLMAVSLIDTLNEKAGKEAFGLCLDTGHLHLVRKDIRTFIPLLGKRIKALHINDNNGNADQHRAPLSGTFSWDLFCQALKNIGYSGDLSFETSGQIGVAVDFDIDMVQPWMQLIRKTGEVFRNKISQ